MNKFVLVFVTIYTARWHNNSRETQTYITNKTGPSLWPGGDETTSISGISMQLQSAFGLNSFLPFLILYGNVFD